MKTKFIIMLMVIVLLLSGCSNNSTSDESDNSTGYATSIEYNGKGNYIFAIEVDEFDGDVLENGTYTFSTASTTQSAIMYDIYISEELKDPLNTLNEEEFFNTSGGLYPIDFEVTLMKGEYVYIVYYEQLMDADGTLTITKLN